MADQTKAPGGSESYGGSGGTRPLGPHQLQKMGNSKHINSFLGPSVPRNPAENAGVHKDKYARKRQSPPAQFGKSKKNSQIPEAGSAAMMSDAMKCMIAGKGTMDMAGDCQRKGKTRAFEAERMILLNTSVCSVESSFTECKNINSSAFLPSGVASSQWQQYADFNVNQKTESLVRYKRKYCWDERSGRSQLQTACGECTLAPVELKSMLEELRSGGEYTVHLSRRDRSFEKKRLCRPVPFWNLHAGSTSGCKLHGFHRLEDARPSGFTGYEDNHPISGVAYKEKLASCNCLALENEISEHCNHLFQTNTEKKNGGKLIWECSWPILKHQSPKACGDSPMDVSGSKFLLAKRSSMEGFIELKESLPDQHFQQSIPEFSTHKLGRCTTLGSVGRPLGISISDEKDGGQSVHAHSMDVRKECDVGTTCLDMDVHVKSLSGGMCLPPAGKKEFTALQNLGKSETTCQDLAGIKSPGNFESTSAMQMKEATCNQEAELLASLNLFPCIDMADPIKPNGLSVSRTDTMGIISDVRKPENSGDGHQPDNLVDADVNSRWVKRLKVNSDSVAIGTRGCKMEDVITTRRVHKLFSRVMNYGRSNSFTLAKCLQERQQFQKTMLLLRNSESPVESLNESHPWIERWCRKVVETGCPRTRKAMEVLYEPEKAKQLPENLEGKLFPSLAAMALMGKSINNFRPCEFRRRGSSLVWNTERSRDQNILLQGAGTWNN